MDKCQFQVPKKNLIDGGLICKRLFTHMQVANAPVPVLYPHPPPQNCEPESLSHNFFFTAWEFLWMGVMAEFKLVCCVWFLFCVGV